MFTLDISLQRSRAITSPIYRAVFICVISFLALGGTSIKAAARPAALVGTPPTAQERLFSRLTKAAVAGDPASQLALARHLFANAQQGSPAYAHAVGWLKLAVDQNYSPAIKAAMARGLPIGHRALNSPTKSDMPPSVLPPQNYSPPPLTNSFFIRLSSTQTTASNTYKILEEKNFVQQLDGPQKLTAKAVTQNTLLIGPFKTRGAAMQAIETAAQIHPFISSLETR